jgi:hypothetical protein
MGFIVYLGEMLEIKMCIDLGRADIRMTKHFLHATQVAG